MISKLSPTEQRIFDVLKDGEPHDPKDLVKCLWDDFGTVSTVRVHVCSLRKKLGRTGHGILIHFSRRKMYYRLVRLLTSPYDGRV